MSRQIHTCISVRGALMNWNPNNWRGATHDDGTPASPSEFKAFLLEELSKGREVIPFGDPCEGFDYSGRGCPGQEEAE